MIFPAFVNLKKLCKGMLVWTHPWGYNTFLDKQIEKQIMPMTTIKGMIRVNDTPNLWEEVEWTEVIGKEYGKPFRNANGLLIIWTDCEQLT